VVAEAWYIACPSRALKEKPLSIDLCGQQVVLFRGKDGRVRCLDAFCPHMGTDLGIGKVVGNTLRCFFHHWRYDGDGCCVDVPAAKKAPVTARLQSYATEEIYGFVWVYPAAEAPAPVPRHPELEDVEVIYQAGISYTRPCHHHVTMINGIDPQHLKTVHGMNVCLELDYREQGNGVIDFYLSGELPGGTWKERLIRRLLGDRYAYCMRYGQGSIGCLSVMKEVRFFPELYMVFAYRPLEEGKTLVQPIYLTPRREGVFGRLVTRLLLWAMKIGFYYLQDEDGKIYENMRFESVVMLPMDAPIGKFMSFINHLNPSVWSRDFPRSEVLSK
jgi:nitrite reductase/ring-hydroxylating ferredoxin subunit